MRLLASSPGRVCKLLRAHVHTGVMIGSACFSGEPLWQRIPFDSIVVGACELGVRVAVCGLVTNARSCAQL
eukprot:3338878-Alexandrium_andersonii.AAC.1